MLKRGSRRTKFIPPVSPPQLMLYSAVKKIYPLAKLNFPIKTDRCTRYADVFIQSNGLDTTHFMIDVEYDGFYHKYKRKQDHERDLELARAGVKTIRVNKKNIQDALKLIEEEIKSCPT